MRNVLYGIVLLALAATWVSTATAATTPTSEYNAKLQKTDQKDPSSLYDLAKWISTKHSKNKPLLLRAKSHLNQALQIDKDYLRAAYLIKRIDVLLKKVNTPAGSGKPTGTGTPRESGDPLVTEKDIYAIRLAEYPQEGDREPSKKDKAIRVKFVKDERGARGKTALQRYVKAMAGKNVDNWDDARKAKVFNAWPAWKKIQEMVRNARSDTALLADIQIQNDPEVLLRFRTKIWPLINTNCGNSSCHGSVKLEKGPLFFDAKRDREMYTNYVMTTCFLSSKKKRMINRQDPTASLLLQYGLDPKAAEYLHPKVKASRRAVKPLFSGVTDPKYKLVLRWIESLNGPNQPDYHVQYVAPRGIRLDLTGEADLPAGLDEKPRAKPAPAAPATPAE